MLLKPIANSEKHFNQILKKDLNNEMRPKSCQLVKLNKFEK